MQTVTYSRETNNAPPGEAMAPVGVTVIDTGMTIQEVAHAIVWCRGFTSMEAFFQELERREIEKIRRAECPELYGEAL